MLRGLSIAVVLSGLALTPMASTSIAAEPSEVSDQNIADAYLYLLGRSGRKTSISATRDSNGMR